jgi:hypothetical protein
MAQPLVIPDGIEVIRQDIPAVVDLIARTARWVHPDTFHALPVWAPHAARGRLLYNAAWTERSTNRSRRTGIRLDKYEGNVAALNALVAALGVGRPRPKNWTVCHIWGYDDPNFATASPIVQDPKYFSCVGNMIWLPTPLKGFTDALPEVKTVIRTCAYYLYNWVCEHPSVEAEAESVRSGTIPQHYPRSWPTSERKSPPPGTAPYTYHVQRAIQKRKAQIRDCLTNRALTYYPFDEVREVLEFWKISL